MSGSPHERDLGPAGTEPYAPARSGAGLGQVRGFALDVVEGPDAPRSAELDVDRCTVGTAGTCDVVLADPTVSRFHCELAWTGPRVQITDLGSHNGTIVSGVEVERAYLRTGSLIRIGRTVLRFERRDRVSSLELSSRQRFGRLVGRSVAMRAVFAALEKAAARKAKVLLQGESGTGKTLTAESIHLESPRRDGPFVHVDCGALPPNLLESELFGHVKGAFTGALSDHAGAFEQADGGTLFLDEIGELSLDLQVKLLRALDRGEIQRVGDDKRRARKVDVRVITASNRDLRAAVNTGQLREDLYYRIAVLVIRLPPLRERFEDLPDISRALLERSEYPESDWQPLLTDELMARLRTGAWPGNIRELANYLERCVVYSRPQPIDNPGESPAGAGRSAAGPVAVDLDAPWARAREAALEQVERFYFTELLRAHGSAAQAARVAGVYPSTFYKKLRAHGVSPDPRSE